MKIKTLLNVSITLSIALIFNYTDCYFIPAENEHNITSLNSFVFGSCYNGISKHRSRYDIFDIIDTHKPDFFMWVGDAAYVRYYSTEKIKIRYKILNFLLGKWKVLNETKIENKFNQTKHNIHYSRFDKKYPVIGVWDDNDYAQNDGNKYFIYKEDVKKLYLNFLDEPRNSIRRKEGRGIYETYSFGDKSTHRNVRIILLDVRYHKSSLFESNRDILGEEQWVWLENILKQNNETFTLIASGSQILPFDRLATECWLPESRERLFSLIAKLKKSGVILLTGDIHNAQILRTPCIIEDIGYHIYEITSSGLGHHNRLFTDIIMDHLLPSFYKFSESINYYNFAKFNFLWGDSINDTKLEISIIDINNVTRIHYIFEYNEFQYSNKANLNSLPENKLFNNSYSYCYYTITSRVGSIIGYIKTLLDYKSKNVVNWFYYLFFFLIGITIINYIYKIYLLMMMIYTRLAIIKFRIKLL